MQLCCVDAFNLAYALKKEHSFSVAMNQPEIFCYNLEMENLNISMHTRFH